MSQTLYSPALKQSPKSKKSLGVKIVKPKVYDPTEISQRLNPPNNHFIIYPTSKGYCFTMFYRSEKTDPFEIVATSHKPYKIKTDCIRAMKKILDGFGGASLISEYTFAYDYKGEKISLKIKYDIKKLL